MVLVEGFLVEMEEEMTEEEEMLKEAGNFHHCFDFFPLAGEEVLDNGSSFPLQLKCSLHNGMGSH